MIGSQESVQFRKYITYMVFLGVLIATLMILAFHNPSVDRGEAVQDAPNESQNLSLAMFADVENDSWIYSRTNSPRKYRSVFILRSDDVSSLSDEGVEYINRIAREMKIPVTHTVVPFWIKEEEEACQRFQEVEENSSLIDFAMHGYSHSSLIEDPFPSEFYSLSYSKQSERIEKGIEIYKNCLNSKPRVFVPPQNTYDNTTVKVLRENNFHAVSGFERQTIETKNIPGLENNFLELVTANSALNFDLKRMKSVFNRSYRSGDVFVQMIHHWELKNSSSRTKLQNFLEYVKSRDVKFMSLNQFSAKARKDKIKYRDGWIIEN